MGITLPTVCQLKRVPVQYFYLLWIDIHSRNLPKIRRRMRSICTGIQEKTFLCEYWIISHLQNRVAHLPSPCVHDFLHRFITCLWMMGEGCSETANSVQRVKKKKKKVSLILRETRAESGRGKSRFSTKSTPLNPFMVPVIERKNELETWARTEEMRSIWAGDWPVAWTRNTGEPLRPLACSKVSPFFSEEITEQDRRDIKKIFKARSLFAVCPVLRGKGGASINHQQLH